MQRQISGSISPSPKPPKSLLNPFVTPFSYSLFFPMKSKISFDFLEYRRYEYELSMVMHISLHYIFTYARFFHVFQLDNPPLKNSLCIRFKFCYKQKKKYKIKVQTLTSFKKKSSNINNKKYIYIYIYIILDSFQALTIYKQSRSVAKKSFHYKKNPQEEVSGKHEKRGFIQLNNHPSKPIHVLPLKVLKHYSCHFPPSHLLLWPTFFVASKNNFKYANIHSHIIHSLFTIVRLSLLPSSSCSLPTLLLILFLLEFRRTTQQPYIRFIYFVIFLCRLNNKKCRPLSSIYKQA